MTTAAVVAYYSNSREALISYAGHPPVLYKRAGDKTWSFALPLDIKTRVDRFPMNLPFDVSPDTRYMQFMVPLSPGDRLFVYTDGVTEAFSPEGDLFGKDRLKDILDKSASAALPELKSKVLEALHLHTGNNLTHDDTTMIAMEIRQ